MGVHTLGTPSPLPTQSNGKDRVVSRTVGASGTPPRPPSRPSLRPLGEGAAERTVHVGLRHRREHRQYLQRPLELRRLHRRQQSVPLRELRVALQQRRAQRVVGLRRHVRVAADRLERRGAASRRLVDARAYPERARGLPAVAGQHHRHAHALPRPVVTAQRTEARVEPTVDVPGRDATARTPAPPDAVRAPGPQLRGRGPRTFGVLGPLRGGWGSDLWGPESLAGGEGPLGLGVEH